MATTITQTEDVVEPFYQYLTTYFDRANARPKVHIARDAGISRMYLDQLLKRQSDVSLRIAINVSVAMGTSLPQILKTAKKDSKLQLTT